MSSLSVWASAGESSVMGAHVVAAVLTSGIFIAAFFTAVALWFQTRRLHDIRNAGGSSKWMAILPPVLRMERILFSLLWAGFALLTALVLSGMFFGEVVWGRALVFNHKVVFTLVAWVVFGVLLLGRVMAGWRGLVAVRATIFGFALLFLAYAGTHFVLDVLLRR